VAKMKKDSQIMITGGLGFVGSTLAKTLLDTGYKNITLLSRSKHKMKNIDEIKDQIHLIIDDVKNIGKHIENIDVIFHLASTVDNYAVQSGEPHRDSETNVLLTSYLLDAIRNVKPEIRLVFGSSFFAVGNPESCPVDETVCCRPISLYGATRLCGEHLVYAYRDAFHLDAVVIRLTNVYGPFERSASTQKAAFNFFIIKALCDETITMYDEGAIRRDMIFVTDAAKGLIRVAEKGTEPLYFIGSGIPRSLKEIFSSIVKTVGSGQIKKIPTPEFHRNVGTGDFWVDNKKLRSLGWKEEVDLVQGIRLTAEYYRANPEFLKQK
jgi:UDP-glucose 4-epimerase